MKNGIICVSLLLLLVLPMATPVWAVYPVFPAAVTIWGQNGSAYNNTATDGTFRFDNALAVGNYSGVVMADGFIDYYFSVAVSAGNTTNLGDILMNQSAKITGYLIGPNGEPIANGMLYLCNPSNGSSVSMAMSSSNGSFAFVRNIRTGTYYIRTETAVPGCADVRVYNVSATAGQTTSGVTVQLARSGAIAGTVKTKTNAPIADADIYAFPSNGTMTFLSSTTDSAGFYNMTWNLPAGTYNVSVLNLGIPGYISSIPDVQVVVQAGQTTTVNFVLDRSANISGTVRYSNGAPAEGVPVLAVSTSGTYSCLGYTDENGRYALDSDLGISNYTVIADYDYMNTEDVSITFEGQSVTGVDFVIPGTPPAKAWIKGTITSNGSPISATVMANYTFIDWNPINGSYTIEVELPEGQTTATYNVTASKIGYYTGFRFPVTVSANQTLTGIDISITKMPTGTVIGRVVSNVAPPKQNASLTLQYSWVGPYPVPVNSTIGIIGTLTPARSGNATLYWSINDSGYIYQWNGTVVNGAFSRDFGLSSPGTWSFKLVWHGDDSYNSATSNVVGITVAAAVTPKQNATLSMSASSANATVGTSVTLSGSLNPAQSGNVSIYSSYNGSAFSLLTNKTLAVGGSYSHSFNLTQVGTYSFYAVWPGNDGYNPATSNTVTVISSPQPAQKTTPTITITSSKTSVTLDANRTSEVITITGTISPFPASTAVNVKVTDPNSQVTTIPLNATSSNFSASVTINKGGTWSIQALIPEGATYNAATSNTVSVSVQVTQAAGGDNTALIAGGAIVVVALAAVLFLFMRKKK